MPGYSIYLPTELLSDARRALAEYQRRPEVNVGSSECCQEGLRLLLGVKELHELLGAKKDHTRSLEPAAALSEAAALLDAILQPAHQEATP